MTRTDLRYQEFLRNVVRNLDSPQLPNALTPEQRVGAAQRTTDVFLASDEPFDLTDEAAVWVAAIIAAITSAEAALTDRPGDQA